MEGAARRIERERDENTTMAYQAAAFRGASQSKKGLPGLEKFLIVKPKRRRQSGAEMLAVMREFAARGAKMDFKRVDPKIP